MPGKGRGGGRPGSATRLSVGPPPGGLAVRSQAHRRKMVTRDWSGLNIHRAAQSAAAGDVEADVEAQSLS